MTNAPDLPAPAGRLDPEFDFQSLNIAVLTVSDTRTAADDRSGDVLAARIEDAGHVLASRGIVGQATEATIVYDAETTHGGSGGPVLDASGEVIAVNTAILPEYGGSNLGVPTALLRQLLSASN